MAADRFKNNGAVLGYDILNEPVGSETRQLSPLFEAAAKVIRANDPNAILFLTPMYLLGNVRPIHVLSLASWDGVLHARDL